MYLKREGSEKEESNELERQETKRREERKRGATHLRNWDLEVLGSPTIQMLISPRRWIPSGVCLWTPPINWRSRPFLTISCPGRREEDAISFRLGRKEEKPRKKSEDSP